VWPALPYDEWRATRDTLHMYMQVIGKLRLALSPFEPEWGNVPLYVTARGLTTSPIPAGGGAVDAELDLIEHALVIRSSDGAVERRPLGGAVADFYRDVMEALGRIGVDVAISVVPSEVDDPIPFPDDRTHDTYIGEHARRFHDVLARVDLVMREHRAGFRGRSTPVHFFWGTFDLALTRFSGRPAEPRPGAGLIERVGGDAEQICAGWWPGSERVPYPAFFAYGYPVPDGIDHATVQPDAAAWSAGAGEFLLNYDAVRSAEEPEQPILAFLRSTYAAAAAAMRWDRSLTDVRPPSAGAEVRTRPAR
jgi:Family of unknown function (DUF5996)